MKILFIYKFERVEPLGIMYLSSFLKKHGHECYFIDLKFEKNFMKEIKKISPDIIAYYIMTGKHKFYKQLNQELKKRFSFFSFFGGPHCTFFPEFINENGVDAICRGEGELSFLELANNLERKKDITKIKNLWVKIQGKVYQNEIRNLIENLDTLPFPDRELIHKYNHYRKMHRRIIMTTRGCPFNCTYCFNHSYNKIYQNKGQIVRRRSIDNVIKELKLIKERYFLKRFIFMDDVFIINPEWVFDFCKIYKREINVPFIINIRANLVNEEIIKALKNAGCITVQYGIESGNEYIRNSIFKRNISTKQIIDTGNIVNKYGLKSLCLNIIGSPDETIDMAFETIAINIKCKPSYAQVSICQPFPGTELCEYAMKKGYFNGDVNSIEDTWHFKKSAIKMKDIEKFVRLRSLFSLCVKFPAIIPLVKILINLPLNRIYQLPWIIHRSWCYFFKVKLIDLSELFIRE